MKILLLITALALQSTPQPVTEIKPLTAEHQRDLGCAAAFAIIASEQERGASGADAYPSLQFRGREFFVKVAQKVMDDTGMSREQVRDTLYGVVTNYQNAVKDQPDPMAYVDGIMTPCLAVLNEKVPEKPAPSLRECAAYLRIAYDEVHAREGLSPAAKDMDILASVLDSRARDELREQGKSNNEMDQIMAETKEHILADAARVDSDLDIDYDHCFVLASPEPGEATASPH